MKSVNSLHQETQIFAKCETSDRESDIEREKYCTARVKGGKRENEDSLRAFKRGKNSKST